MVYLLKALPPELLSYVLDLLENHDLKQLRAADHSLHTLCTPRLFETFVIFPHRHSLQDLVSLSQCDVRKYVRHLCYETRYRMVPIMAIRRLHAVWSSRISRTDMMEIHQQAEQDEIEALCFERRGDDRAQLTMLQEAFANLSNIHKISISGPGCYSPAEFSSCSFPLPSFYARMLSRTCNRFMDTRLEHGAYGFSGLHGAYLAPLIEAARILPQGLSELNVSDIGLADMLRHLDYPRSAWMHKHTLSSIRKFRLETAGSDSSYMIHLSRLVSMLEQMLELEDLHLALRTPVRSFSDEDIMVEESGASPYTSMLTGIGIVGHITQGPAKPLYSGPLQRLTLFGLRVTSQELKAVLTPHLNNLEYLALGDLTLVPTALRDPRACIVRMFKWIQAGFSNLQEVHLCGGFSNCGMQRWVADEGDDPQTGIRYEVEQFLIHGGVCPLETHAIPDGYFDVGISAYAPGATAQAYRGHHFDGDATWYTAAGVSDSAWAPDDDQSDELSDEDEYEEYSWSDDELSEIELEDELEDNNMLDFLGAGYIVGVPYGPTRASDGQPTSL